MCCPLYRTCCWFLGVAFVAAAFFRLASPAGLGKESADQGLVHVGIVETLFRDIPDETIQTSAEPFKNLMQEQTGRKGDFITVKDPYDLARRVEKDELDLGAFHGFEYAWVREKYADLKPLAIAVNQDQHLRALIMVPRDSAAADLSGLKGKSLAIPAYTREHCRLFLDDRLRKTGQEAKQYFSEIPKPANVEDGLDDVVDGLTQAVLVDGVALERYKMRKPGRFSKLKELDKSVVFPAAVVAYRAGALDEETITSFRNALKRAGDTPDGRQMLTLWKLTGYEDVPDDYEQTLKDVVKAYPPPQK